MLKFCDHNAFKSDASLYVCGCNHCYSSIPETCSCSQTPSHMRRERMSLSLLVTKRNTCNKYFHRNLNTAAANAILSRSTQSSLHRLHSPFSAPHSPHLLIFPLQSFALHSLRPHTTKHGKCPTLVSALFPRPPCSHPQPSSRCHQHRTMCTLHRLGMRCGRRSMGCLGWCKLGMQRTLGKLFQICRWEQVDVMVH